MSSISSDVQSIYRAADSGNLVDTRYEVVPGPCWFRGVVFYIDAQVLDTGSSVAVSFHNGDVAEEAISLGVGASLTMAQFMIPDESYVNFPDGIYLSSEIEAIIDNIYLVVFYS